MTPRRGLVHALLLDVAIAGRGSIRDGMAPTVAPSRHVPPRGTVSKPVLVRVAVLACGAVVTLAAGTLVAPAALADTTTAPGLADLPAVSAASPQPPVADTSGRKLR